MFHPEYYCNAKFRSPWGPALLNASWTQLGVLGFTSALPLSTWRGVRCRRWRAGEGSALRDGLPPLMRQRKIQVVPPLLKTSCSSGGRRRGPDDSLTGVDLLAGADH